MFELIFYYCLTKSKKLIKIINFEYFEFAKIFRNCFAHNQIIYNEKLLNFYKPYLNKIDIDLIPKIEKNETLIFNLNEKNDLTFLCKIDLNDLFRVLISTQNIFLCLIKNDDKTKISKKLFEQ